MGTETIKGREFNLQPLLHNAPDAIVVINPESDIIFWNPAAEKLFGWTSEEVFNKPLAGTIIPTQYREAHYHGMNRFMISNQHGINKTVEITALNKAGEEFYISLTISTTTLNGNIAFISFIRDIREKKKNEEELKNKKKELEIANSQLESEKIQAIEEKKRFEFLANVIPNLIFTVSCDGKVNFMNDRFCEYSNYSKSNLPENSFLQLVHAHDSFRVARLWTKCFKEEKRFDAEVRIRNGNGNYEWFLVRALPYKDETGKVSTWFGSCTNINDQKEKQLVIVDQLNSSLSTADKIISRKEETLKEIAFDQAHLIRMPLSNVLGLIQLMETMDMDEEMQNVHALLQDSSTQLDEVIKNIVDKSYTSS